jgi:hypothetical protein
MAPSPPPAAAAAKDEEERGARRGNKKNLFAFALLQIPPSFLWVASIPSRLPTLWRRTPKKHIHSIHCCWHNVGRLLPLRLLHNHKMVEKGERGAKHRNIKKFLTCKTKETKISEEGVKILFNKSTYPYPLPFL